MILSIYCLVKVLGGVSGIVQAAMITVVTVAVTTVALVATLVVVKAMVVVVVMVGKDRLFFTNSK